MFRWPSDTEAINRSFYHDSYHEGLTTEVPDRNELSRMLESDFVGTNIDYAEKIALLQQVAPQGRALDYGCSWGYGVYKLQRAGYEAIGYELSKYRADYGRSNLDVNISADFSILERSGKFDVVFCNHVLEHCNDIGKVLTVITGLVANGGVLAIFVPNCDGARARAEGVKWGPMISEKHILAMTAEFFARNLPKYDIEPSFASSPYTALSVATMTEEAGSELPGDELFVLGRKTS
jgi:2-polyprenyl-3-methyl-5-hydroxy-6-metoxy-1,4-benzoquinol methylase